MLKPTRLTVLGLGNELLGDDGVGVYVVRALRGEPLPDGVELVEAGTGGLSLVKLIEQAKALLVIDAAEMGAPVGTYRWLSPEQVGEPQGLNVSLRDGWFIETLLAAGRLLRRPATTIFAIQPASTQRRRGLSGELSAKVPELVHAVCDSLWQRHRHQFDR